MSQVSSSLRAAAAARASLRHPRVVPQRHRSLPTLQIILPRQSAISSRYIGSCAKTASFPTADIRSCRPDLFASRSGAYDVHRRPPFVWTAQCMMSTTTTDPINIDGGAGDVGFANEQTEAEHINDIDAESIPLKRSKRGGPEKAVNSGFGFDDRAQAKLTALTSAKKEMEDAKAKFLASVDAGSADGDDAAELRERWNRSEEQLALAYSQAIKYTSRIPKNPEATKVAEQLLIEWMDRFMDSFGVSLSWADANRGSGAHLNKTKMVRTVHKVISTVTGTETLSESQPLTASTLQEGGGVPLANIRIPPPTSKDYINLLRAYSLSKARRKGQQCESLIKNMVRVVKTVAHHYEVSEGGACGENDVPGWKSWMVESVPNSKAFALAIKCHAGTTHKESLERILLLNEIHDGLARYVDTHVPGMHQDDPYVLFHSIKALKNLQKKEEMEKGREWLRRLHKFVTSPENANYYGDEASASAVSVAAAPETIDVTSAYVAMLRLLARLRGAGGAAAEARLILNRMHRVHDGVQSDENDGEMSGGSGKIASIDIRSNAYNLVLGLHRDSKKPEDAVQAVSLLQRMVDAGNEAPENRRGVPLPNEQSFEFAILSLANMTDADAAIQEAERLVQLMQDQDYLESPAAAYNAFITVCNKKLFGKPVLLDKSREILEEMTELSKTHPEATPNPETLALVMKACSLSEHDDHDRVLDMASKLFSQLEAQEQSEQSAVALSDRAYFYMMKCVDEHMIGDPDAKKERIEELFSGACERGLCSANVLAMFRNSVTDEDYKLTVGEGRLADRWIANITGPRALYTDGSSGGAGKHARRKGKSTSDWAKKQKVKEQEKESRRKDKQAKKFFRKMKA
ncbi:hypothetical protein ACHAXT_004353 [Thalassiosira profunda]